LLVKSVPYVNAKRTVARGVLVCPLEITIDATSTPADHTVMWTGEYPCRADGTELTSFGRAGGRETLDTGLIVDHKFSNKSTAGPDRNYYDKMIRYITIISGQATAIDPSVTPKVNRFVESVEEDSPFVYADTASSHDGIAAISRKLELRAIAIVGVGGTGAYVLDLVAKTPVKAIHLFDGDRFLQHSAFRAPGAASVESLRTVPDKVAYLKMQYSHMHRGIVAHEDYLDGTNLEILRSMQFVFLCLDRGRIKKEIVAKLIEWGIPFVNCGMGIQVADGAVGGILTVTMVTPTKQDHWERRIAFSDADPEDDYSRNIQIADLNALNAALAVIKWKKHFGFYRDLGREHHSTYSVDVDLLTNDEIA
jgi:uncharacterized protein DUF6791/ThiF family protein